MNKKSKPEQIFILISLVLIICVLSIAITGCNISSVQTAYGHVSHCGGCWLGPILGPNSSICRLGSATEGFLPNAISCGTAANSRYLDCTLGSKCFGCYLFDGGCATRAFGYVLCNPESINQLDEIERLADIFEFFDFMQDFLQKESE